MQNATLLRREQAQELRLVDHRHAERLRLVELRAGGSRDPQQLVSLHSLTYSDTDAYVDEITFIVQGSAAEPYTVQFKKSGDNLSAYCTCPAGEVGQICKHRIRILEGSVEGIVSGNAVEVKMAASWLSGSKIESAMQEIRAAEERLEFAKKEVATLKKKLAKVLVS